MPSKKAQGKRARKRGLDRCHTCGKPIRVPKGWSRLPAVRRHYWKYHPEIMRGSR
ncbi:MAG: hypothetical protein ACRDKB_05035 [Actinomycetota bacterium]